jgi:glycosyltransferase involved in cell wall biosynthesis
MAKKASRIIAVSTAVEQELLREQVHPSVISRIANGVDRAHYCRCMDKCDMRKKINLPEKKTIIYTGRLSAEKGVDFLIRSFSKMEKKQPCQLVINADGPEKKTILHLINQCNVIDAVLLVDAIEDVAWYLNASDVFVLPSRFEGLSNALLEAMACGLAVISTRVGGSTDIIEDGVNGLLVNVDSEEQLVGAMVRILKERQLAHVLGENARKTVEAHHDIGKIADSYLAVYKGLHHCERHNEQVV